MSKALTNNPSPFASIAPEDIVKFAAAALATVQKNEASTGLAQQKLCACVIAQHERDVDSPPPVEKLPLGVPPLATLTSDAKNAVQYRAYLKLFFVGTFDEKAKFANEDDMNNRKKLWAKRNTILQNAIKLAVALMSASGGVVRYDAQKSLFLVLGSMLLPKDAQPTGQLQAAIKRGDYLPLDGHAWRYEPVTGPIVTVFASISQVVRAYESRAGIPAKPKATVANATTGNASSDDAASDGKASGPKIDSRDMTFEQHIIAAAKIVQAGGALRRDWLTNDGWNALVALVQQYDTIQGDTPTAIAA